ncbi:MAG: hypothetical protein A2428_02655 [Bdellovibrionales bacterium RIFOXYC1_FULL_54_43]|nr:MAG: hypothetical protein A2428_02655 [Bdellovibrionales bacterium RIFOXYC1_FULL_54_43]
MAKMKHTPLSLLLPILISFAILPACDSAPLETGSEAPTATDLDTGEEPATVPMAFANGWTEITMIANYAKTVMDSVGHFTTSRNACGKEDAGAIDLGLWNSLAAASNQAVVVELLPSSGEYCLPHPEGLVKRMDGTAEVTLANGSKRTLFETRGYEACTTISDRQVATELLNSLNKMVSVADLEGCPNGWGS